MESDCISSCSLLIFLLFSMTVSKAFCCGASHLKSVLFLVGFFMEFPTKRSFSGRTTAAKPFMNRL